LRNSAASRNAASAAAEHAIWQAIAAILAFWALVAYPAQALPFFKPFLPDFYQHQKAGPIVNVPDDADVDFGNAAPQCCSRVSRA
jgi:hypothetical protein